MANDAAWQTGWQEGKQRSDERRAHKQALSDAQFQEKHNEIQGMIGNLSTKLAAVPEDARNTPDYLKMQDQLAQAIQSRDAHWKSLDHPNAIMKFGKMLGKDLRFKKQESPTPVAPPVYGQPTIQTPASQGESVTLSGEPAQPASDRVDMVDGHLKATRDPGSPALSASTVSLGGSEAGPSIPAGPAYKVQGPQTPAQMKAAAEAAQLVASGPVSPEQAATQQGRAESAKSLAEFQGNMKLYDQNHPEGIGPTATPEGKQARNEYLNSLIQSPAKANYKPDVQPLTLSDGTTISAQWEPNSKRWQYLNGEEIPASLLAGAKITPKPVAKKGLRYDAATGEILDQDTQKRYSIADIGKPGTPPEVAQMFQDSKAAMDEKQRKALELANQRGVSLGANRYTGFVDPSNPTQVIPATWGDAAKRGLRLATGAQYKSMESMLDSSTSGPIAEQMVAFSTAFQHADLLENAAKALNNGDTRLMNQVTNDLATQFGDEAPTNFTTIATAYTREVNKALSSGHVTDAELTTVGATIPLNASPEQILGAIQAYRKLMQSKINIRLQQIQAGMQGTPFTGVGTTSPQTPGGAGGNATPKPKKRISIKMAMMLPENKGKTEAEVTKHLTDSGYTPVKP